MVAAAASPPPALAPHAAGAGRPHPTYTKMITHALTELGGAAARPAIAEHILARFSGLPARHDDLLSAHLRRLVAEGVLRAAAGGPDSYAFDPPPPPPPSQEERRGPGRPPREDSPVPLRVVVGGEKRGRGRPRKNPQGSSSDDNKAAGGTAAPASVLPTKRKLAGEEADPIREAAGGQEARIFQNGGDVTQSGGASSSTGIKRGRRRPRKDKTSPAAAAAAAAAMSPGTKRGRGRPRKYETSATAAATMFPGIKRKGIKRGRGRPRKDMTSPAASAASAAAGAMSPGIKRGRGRPPKEKPSAAARSPATAVARSRGSKTGCGRPSMGRPSAATSAATSMEKLAAAAAAAMYADAGVDAASAGGCGQSRIEKLAAAVAAMSAEEINKRGTPRKEKTAAPAGVKRSRGRPRKDQCITGLVEAAVEELFRDMMTEGGTRREEEDLASVEKTQTESVAATGDRKETRATDAAGVPNSGENAASAPVGAINSDLGPADYVVSTGLKRGRGRPRKNPAIRSPETGDAASAAGGGQSRIEKLAAAVAAMSAEEIKKRGTPRMAALAGVKRSRGRPRKDQLITGLVEAAVEELFRDAMTEDSTGREDEDLASAEKTRTECVAAPLDGKETRAADAGCVPVSGENAASAPVGAIDSDLGPADLADSTGREDEDVASVQKTQTECVAAPGDKKETRAADAGRVPVSGEDAASAPVGAIDSHLGPADYVMPTGLKRGRGRPRKNPAIRSPETGDAASTAVKRPRGRPRMNPAVRSPETGDVASKGVKRPRGRPRINPAAAVSASTGVKRGRGRPRKKQRPAPADVSPRKDQSFGTGSVESAGEVLFRDMTQGPGDSVLAGKTQTEGMVAPGDS